MLFTFHVTRMDCKLLFLLGFLLFTACNQSSSIKHPEGKKLAEKHCQSCHLLPSPKELDRSRWKNDVLPNMGERMGINTGKMLESDLLKELNLFPPEPQLNRADWNQLMDYYIDNAPLFDHSYSADNWTIEHLGQFEAKKLLMEVTPPFITLLHWDEATSTLFYGNDASKSLHTFSKIKEAKQVIGLSGAPSWMQKEEGGIYVLTMGKVMPHNKKMGTLSYIPVLNNAFGKPRILINHLQRPVHASLADLDGDGMEDIVLSCFGNYHGELVWYSNFQSENRKKRVLRPLPGAVKAEIYDFNKDGLLDVLALMAQGDEGFFLYQNNGNGNFIEIALMRFPPTYGSTYFDLIDFNKDGNMDILYTNGDNGDYYPIRKGYHGIRLFLNNGQNKFSEAFFLPQHGAFKAKAQDFDGDGDLDIAAISYFPDYKNRAREGFLYYENKGGNQFQARAAEYSKMGKWLTMETGDMDLDGDIDIVLGSAMFMQVEVPSSLKAYWRQNGEAILFLENCCAN